MCASLTHYTIVVQVFAPQTSLCYIFWLYDRTASLRKLPSFQLEIMNLRIIYMVFSYLEVENFLVLTSHERRKDSLLLTWHHVFTPKNCSGPTVSIFVTRNLAVSSLS